MTLNEAIILDITLPELPTSVNEMYAQYNGHRVKSAKAKKFTREMIQKIHLENPGFTIPADREFEFFLVCFYPAVLPKKKDDKLKSNDSDNRLKAMKDTVFAASCFDEVVFDQADDNQVFADYCAKRRGKPEMLGRYPKGYCRAILAYRGFTWQVLELLEGEAA